MIAKRVKEWLAEHPRLLNYAFVVLLLASEEGPDQVGNGSAYLGP